MDALQEKLKQYKYHLSLTITASLALSLLLYVAPRLVSILAYFWPLFASTTVFLVLIIAFGGVSKLTTDSNDEKTGQGILDYVAGRPEHFEDSRKYE